MYRTFHPKIAEYIFFSSVNQTFSVRDHKTVSVNLRRLDNIHGIQASKKKKNEKNPRSSEWLSLVP